MSTPEPPYPMRLQKFLARAGVASRRGAENLMTAGRVQVNGQVVTELGTKVDPKVDVVAVDGVVHSLEEESAWIMVYKPAGYVTTMSDPHARHTVAELVPTKRYPGLFPIGRLDRDTTGLLLFTTDGDGAQGLLHPSAMKDKDYVALVEGEVTDRELEPLRRGIVLDDGPCAPAAATVLSPEDPRVEAVAAEGIPYGFSVVALTIHEGRKHQVKKMLRAVGHRVHALHRDGFGPLLLTGLQPGQWRDLTADERQALEKTLGRSHHGQ